MNHTIPTILSDLNGATIDWVAGVLRRQNNLPDATTNSAPMRAKLLFCRPLIPHQLTISFIFRCMCLPVVGRSRGSRATA